MSVARDLEIDGGGRCVSSATTGNPRAWCQSSGESGGGGVRVFGFCDGSDDDDPVCAGVKDAVEVVLVDAADGEPWTCWSTGGQVADRDQGGVWSAGFGGCCPDRAQAEVVDAVVVGGRGGLRQAVAAQSDDHLAADDPAGRCRGKVALAQVQHIRSGGQRHVRAVVHGEQFAVPAAGVGEHCEQVEFVSGLQVLFPKLDDIDAAGQHRVEELGQVTLSAAGVGTKVQTCVGQATGGHRNIKPAQPDRRMLTEPAEVPGR